MTDCDRAAELAAIRSRAEQPLYEYGEDRDGSYIACAWLLDCTNCRIIEINEPENDECAALQSLVQAQADRRVLLARLDALEAAIRSRAAREHDAADALRVWHLVSRTTTYAEHDIGCVICAAYREAAQAQADRRVLLARLDAAEAECNAIAKAVETGATAFNATIQQIAEERDNARALLADVRAYLERLPSRTPERERLITAIVAQLGPRSARIDELP